MSQIQVLISLRFKDIREQNKDHLETWNNAKLLAKVT